MLETTSEVLTFIYDQEEKVAGWYDKMAAARPAEKDRWLGFAGESRKDIAQLRQAYYGVISDALEGCFAFNIDPAAYALTLPPAGAEPDTAALLEMEAVMIRLYTDAAQQASSLMADVPRTMQLIARRRAERKQALGSG